jgi:O-antigen/teichoic acid export membrane protein
MILRIATISSSYGASTMHALTSAGAWTAACIAGAVQGPIAISAGELPPSDIPPGTLQRSFLSGVAWGGGARWSAQAISWASTIMVARLLAPADYGIVGMATVVIGILALFSEFGVGLTVVTLRDLSRAQIAQLHGLAMLLGAAAFVVACAVAPAVASFFHTPVLTAVISVLGLSFVAAGPRLVPAALLQRDFRFGLLARIETAQALTAAAITLTAASLGFGYWSLVFSTVGGSLVLTALVCTFQSLPASWPRLATLRQELTFTRRQMTGNLAWYAYSNADFVVAGRLLGTTELGIYTLAWTLARMVPERVASIVIRVTPAIFSAVRHDLNGLRIWVLGITEGLALITFPALIGLAITCDDVVLVALGEKWRPAVLPLRLLLVFGILDVINQVMTRALTALGDVRFTMRIGLVLLCLMPPAFVAGALWRGPVGIALVWLALNPPVRLWTFVRMRRLMALRVSDYARALWPAVSSTLAMAAVVMATRIALGSAPPVWRAAATIGAGTLAYVFVVSTAHRRRLAAAIAVVRQARMRT